MAGACWASRPSATRSRRPWMRPTAPQPASTGRGCTIAATSAIARWRAARREEGGGSDMATTDGKMQVGIVMGSDSDWETMEAAAERLESFEITYEVQVMSAHRSPKTVMQYAQTARRRGLSVIIAGAGAAAHLAGVVAAHTTIPVIGVPVAAGSLLGLDALLATVQMPPGVPVATVAIGRGGAENAAILAAQIIGLKSRAVRTRLERFKVELAESVEGKNIRLQRKIAPEHNG